MLPYLVLISRGLLVEAERLSGFELLGFPQPPDRFLFRHVFSPSGQFATPMPTLYVVRVFVGCTFLPFFSFLLPFFDAMVFLLASDCPHGRFTSL